MASGSLRKISGAVMRGSVERPPSAAAVSRWASRCFISSSVTRCYNKKVNHFTPPSQTLPKWIHSNFYLQVMFSKLPKKLPNIWATFVRKFVTKAFQKSPNWLLCVIWLESDLTKKSRTVKVSDLAIYLFDKFDIRQRSISGGNGVHCLQCDQIGRFFALCSTF